MDQLKNKHSTQNYWHIQHTKRTGKWQIMKSYQ